MDIEFSDEPLTFRLCGMSSEVPGEAYADVGVKLMDEVWPLLHEAGTPTTGINHWVYLLDGRMFVGVELADGAAAPEGLETLELELTRYLRHLHIGPYNALPAKWKQLKEELAERGEAIAAPSLEVYGHHGDDPEALETTILIGLAPQ